MALEEDNKTELGTLRRHDLVVAIVLWCVSAVVFLDSFRLTFNIILPGVDENTWLVAPGLLPLFFSGGLLLMCSTLIFLCIKQGEFKGHFTKMAIGSAITNPETITKILQMLLLCVFVFGLIGRLHFGVAAAIYLIAAMWLAKAAKLYQIIIISVLFAGFTTFIFGTLMKIPLP